MKGKRLFKRKAALKRTYNQDIGIIRSNIKVQISKLVELFKKFKGLKYGTS